MLHLNEQQTAEKDGDTEKECHKPVLLQKTSELN